jgi:hypothetical protein
MDQEHIKEAFPETTPYPWLKDRVAEFDGYVAEGLEIREIARRFDDIEPGRVKSYLTDTGKIQQLKKIRRSKSARKRKSKKTDLETVVNGKSESQRATTTSKDSYHIPDSNPTSRGASIPIYGPGLDGDIISPDYELIPAARTSRSEENYVGNTNSSRYTRAHCASLGNINQPVFGDFGTAQPSPESEESVGSDTQEVQPQAPQRRKLTAWEYVRSIPGRKKSNLAKGVIALGLVGASLWGMNVARHALFRSDTQNGYSAGIASSTSDRTNTAGLGPHVDEGEVSSDNYQKPRIDSSSKPVLASNSIPKVNDKPTLARGRVYDWRLVHSLTDRNGDGILSKEESRNSINVMYRINTKFTDGTYGNEMRVQDEPLMYVLRDDNFVPKEKVDFKTFSLDQMIVKKYGVETAVYSSSDLAQNGSAPQNVKDAFSKFNDLYRLTLESKLSQ